MSLTRCSVIVWQMLMPLSIAAVLGGTCTLIGTSTNLVVSGAQQARYAKTDPANGQFKIFDIAPYGVPYAIWGFLFVIFMQASNKSDADLQALSNEFICFCILVHYSA